jgi:hypothetical protein
LACRRSPALDAEIPASWVTADEAYGQDGKVRIWLQKRHIGYVLAVPRSQKIPRTAAAPARTLWQPPHQTRLETTQLW